MRLKNVEHGHTPRQKAFLEQAQASRGKTLPLPDIIRLMLYRPELFGTPFSLVLEDAMHKPSDWSFGERELFAAFVSHQNQCAFWTGSHGAVASTILSPELVQSVLQDWHTAPIPENLRAMLGFLQKLTLSPADIGPADILPLRAENISDSAIEDTMLVCTLFNIIDRIADSLNFAVPSAEDFARTADVPQTHSYAPPPINP